jgi:hypothetical protein
LTPLNLIEIGYERPVVVEFLLSKGITVSA